MVGWTRDEYRLWLVPGGLLERVDRLGAVALAGAMARCHCGPEVPRGYRALHPDAGTAEIVGQMVTDHLLRVPLHRLADARPDARRTSTSSPGPPPLARPRRLPRPGARLRLRHRRRPRVRPSSPARVPRRSWPTRCTRAWVRFAADGDPGWQAWDDSHPVRIFGDGEPHTAYGPRDPELALWDGGRGRPGGPAELCGSRPASRFRPGRRARAEPQSVVRRLRLPGGSAGRDHA